MILYEPPPHPELFISSRNDILKEYLYVSLLFQQASFVVKFSIKSYWIL